jgi:cell division protein FtsB
MPSMAWLRGFLWRQWPSLILAAILLALISNCLIGSGGPRDLLILRRAYARLDAKRERLRAENAKLETTVQNLRSNKRFIEHRIRRELGYTRPDELVYKFTAPNARGANR